jgi:hypothetical protein
VFDWYTHNRMHNPKVKTDNSLTRVTRVTAYNQSLEPSYP